jgi:hypothetical protein
MDKDIPYRGLSKVLGLDLMLMLEDTVYLMKRKDHPE